MPALDPLPIDVRIPEAVRLLAGVPSLVLKAPPGAGKTTRVPAALLDGGLIPQGARVLCLEPRRIAARMAAGRVARERGGGIGEEVGYRVRFESAVSPSTRLCFVTGGVFLRLLQGEAALEGIGAVVLDEFHERGLESDLALALLQEVRETIRPDLLLVVMSATLDPAPLARYLGNCPVLESAGRVWPVEVRYLPFAPEVPLEERGRRAVSRLLRERPSPAPTAPGAGGSILFFVPGAAEIRRVMAALGPLASEHGMDLVPLHGDLPAEEQQAAVLGKGRPRIIVSTNLAEASVTVEGVDRVIDSGLARVARYDPGRGLDRLATERISRSSARQRAGRAGRQGPGFCLRLYGEVDFEAMEESFEPEVRRVDLSEAVLRIVAWGHRDPGRFPWLTAPGEATVERAVGLLEQIGSISRGGAAGLSLTSLGRSMLRFPVHPRIGRILTEAERRGCLPEAAVVGALLSERAIRVGARASFGRTSPPGRAGVQGASGEESASSDLLPLADALETARRLRFDPAALGSMGIDARAARRVDLVARQLRRLAAGAGRSGPQWDPRAEEDLLRCIASAYPDRLVRSAGPGTRRGLMVGGIGVRLDPASVADREDLYAALLAAPRRDREGRTVLVRLASGVKREWLRDLFAHLLVSSDEAVFDQGACRVVGRRVLRLLDLPLEVQETGAVEDEQAARILCAAASGRWQEILAPTRDLQDWLGRLRWAARVSAEGSGSAGIPGVERVLEAALRALCPGRRSFTELRKAPWVGACRGALAPGERDLLDSLAPEMLKLPGGRMCRVLYREEGAPVVAGRIQEFFGTARTPTVGSGRVPVLLHLLAPNQRPVQVTSDLPSFWRNVYPGVRSQLRRRYPKHDWPEDPLSARPAGTRHR